MKPPLPSLGLVGDGDEMGALRDVERAFGIKLDDSDAQTWHTLADVYAVVLRALDAEPVGGWRRFARAISQETGVDPSRLLPESTLFSPGNPLFGAVKSALARLWRGQP